MPKSPRQETQSRRELHAVEWCAEWHSRRTGAFFSLLPRVDTSSPPDGLISSKHKTRWVEVVSVTQGEDWDKYSHEIGDGLETALPKGPFMNPDKTFAKVFATRLARKLNKKSYEQLAATYGPGLLVLSVFYVFFDSHTMREIKREINDRGLSFKDSHFSDGVVLVNPYHSGPTIGLRRILPSQ
jgi:hypothetical protein